MSNNNSGQPDSHGALLRSTSIISVGTLASRVLGFVRDVILAKFFGTGFQADAFFVAFKIPNLFRDFVGEGAANSAVVPVFSEYLVQKERREFWRFVSVILALALMCLILLTSLGILLSPYIVRLMAPGFMAHPGKLAMTVQLTRIMFPYLILIGLTAYSMALLYSFRLFTVPAFSPCLLNIAMIISALVSSRFLKEPVYGLAIGVLTGGFLQLLVQLGPMLKLGVKIYNPLPLNHPAAVRVGRLLLPRLVGAGVYQLNIFIDTFCASLSSIVGAGGISAIYYANRIIQFPMGVFGVALASATLPTLSGLAAQNNLSQLKKTLVFTLESIFFVMIPFSVMLMLLAHPIIRILFERGEFTAYSTTISSWALLFYSIGLFSFGGTKILVTAFYALQDTKTPVKIAVVCLVINTVLNFGLMIPLKVGGIALASSVAALVDFIWLFYCLDKRLWGIDGGFKIFVAKIVAASLVAGMVVSQIWNTACVPDERLRLFLAVILGALVYGSVCFMLKIGQARAFYRWLQNLGTKAG